MSFERNFIFIFFPDPGLYSDPFFYSLREIMAWRNTQNAKLNREPNGGAFMAGVEELHGGGFGYELKRLLLLLWLFYW